MAETELKPCPFCGGRACPSDSYDEDARWLVLCLRCRNGTAFYVIKERAIDAWNTRAADIAPAGELVSRAEDLAEGLTSQLFEVEGFGDYTNTQQREGVYEMVLQTLKLVLPPVARVADYPEGSAQHLLDVTEQINSIMRENKPEFQAE